MTQAVRGRINGFVPVPIEGGVAKVGDLEVTPELVFTGSVVDVYRYSLTNTGKDSIDMTETAFYKKGVKAVSFFPRLSLKPGERGYVFLLSENQPLLAKKRSGDERSIETQQSKPIDAQDGARGRVNCCGAHCELGYWEHDGKEGVEGHARRKA